MRFRKQTTSIRSAILPLLILGGATQSCAVRITSVKIPDTAVSVAAGAGAASTPSAQPSASPTVTAPLVLAPNTVVMGRSLTQTFEAYGGSGSYTYSISGAALGSTINSTSGVLTAGTTSGTLTVQVTDSAGSTSTASVTIYHPADNATLTQWLKADALALADGAKVSSWTDSKGTYPATQATTARQPVYKTAILNSKPVVRFDGTQSRLDSTNVPATGASARTIALVIANGAAPTNGNRANIYGHGSNNSYGNAYGLSLRGMYNSTGGGAGFAADYHNGNAMNAPYYLNISSPSSYNSGPAVIIQSYDGTNDSLYINGVQVFSKARTLNTLNTNGIALGTNFQDDSPAAVDIAEFMTFTSAVTASERKNVECYLASKYGVAVSNGTLCAGGTLKLRTATGKMVTQASGSTLTLVAQGGAAPYSYSLQSGGGSVDSTTGVFTPPASAGTSVLKVTDASGATATLSIQSLA